MFKILKIIIIITLFGYFSSSHALQKNRHINLTLANAEKSMQNFSEREVRLNRQTEVKPSESKKEISNTDLVVVGIDKDGRELSRQVVKNPLYFRAEIFNQGTGSIEFSKDIKRKSALLNIIIPDSENLYAVKLYEIEKGVNGIQYKYLKTARLEQSLELDRTSASLDNRAASGVFKVLDNGNSNNRVDLVFLSEGYTQSQLSQFSGDVNNVINGYFNVPPYLEYKNLYNVWRVEVASAASGAGNGSPINTRFGAHFGCYGIARLLCVDETKVLNYINSVMQTQEADQVVVIVNTTTYGGAGGTVATMSLASSAIDLALHEVGHSFGKLADEYTNGTCITSEPTEANATTSSSGSKWSHWFGVASNVNAFQGARYCTSGMYRPTSDSMMNHLGVPFYQVNEEELVKRTYHFVKLVDSHSPALSSVNIAAGQQQTFSVNTIAPVPDTIEVKWYLNNVLKASGKQFTMAANDYANATYTLTAKVKDKTAKVIKDTNKVTEDSKSWQVISGGIGNCLPTSPNSLVSSNVTHEGFFINWSVVSNATSYQVQVYKNGQWVTQATVSQPGTNLIGFTPESTVKVRIIAVNSCGSSSPSVVLEVTMKTDPGDCLPGQVGPINATNITTNSFVLNWQRVANEDTYQVQVLENNEWKVKATTSGTNATLSGYSAGSKIKVRVVAVNPCATGIPSAILEVTLATDPGNGCTVAPTTPTGLRAEVYNSYYFRLFWDQTNQATAYSVQRWNGYSWQNQVTTDTNKSGWLYLTGKQYIRVNASNDCGNSDFSSWISVR